MSKQFTKGAASSSQTQSMMGMMGSQGMLMQLKADKCPFDLGYYPMNQEMGMGGMGGMGGMDGMGGMGDEWRGKDCDNPFKPVTHPKCKYQDKQEEDTSQNDDIEKEDKMESKLECAYQKWKFEDERAKTNINKKMLQDKRRSKMLPIIKQICHYYKPFCNNKDLMGIPKEPDERCVETLSCDDRWPDLHDIPDDVKYFSKLIFDIFDFSKLKDSSDDETDKQKDKDERREKAKELDKEMKALSIKYKNLAENIPEQAKDEKCINKGRSQIKPRNLDKNHIVYESMRRCFSSSEEKLIKEYIKKRDEKVKVKPSFGRRLGRFKRTLQKKGRDIYKSAKKLSEKKITLTGKNKMNEMSKVPSVRKQQIKDAKSSNKCKVLSNIELRGCIKDYIKDRKDSGMVMDDFNKVNMDRKADTIQQRDYLENQDVKTKIKDGLEIFKNKNKNFKDLSESAKLNMLKKVTEKLQQKSYDSFKKTPKAKEEKMSLINKEKKKLEKFSLFSQSNALKKTAELEERKSKLAKEGVNVSGLTGEKKGKLNKAKFWEKNNITTLEKKLEKTKEITKMDLDRGIINETQARQQNKDYASGKLKKEKGAKKRGRELDERIKSGVLNSLEPEKREEFIKHASNLSKIKKEKNWYGTTKKSSQNSSQRTEFKLKMSKLAGNNKSKDRTSKQLMKMINSGEFKERAERKKIITNNIRRKESKNGPVSNNRMRQIEDNITDKYRGSNTLGFKDREKKAAIKSAIKRTQANNLGIENVYNLSNSQSTWRKWTPFVNSRSDLQKAINKKKNNISNTS